VKILVLLVAGALVLAGYVHASLFRKSLPPPAPAAALPRVTVATPVVRPVVDYLEAVGRTAAVESVQVRARVSGHLQRIHFREGAELSRGAALFDIDPRPFRIQLAQAEANLRAARARLGTVTLDLARQQALGTRGYAPRQTIDQLTGSRDETRASLDGLEAAVARARLDLEFTHLTAPVDGRVGRALVTEGNLIDAGTSVLTTLVSVDRMHAFFELDERRVADARRRGVLGEGTPVELGLTGEVGFPHRGTIDYVDNTVEPGTATLAVRALFDNSRRTLTPGMFGRVRIPLGPPRDALMVPEQALGTDQSGTFLKLVGADGTVEQRPVVAGRVEAGLVAIASGLKAAERVVVRGLQRARPGTKVLAQGADAR
jgi:RND family efflux transporter MFP subunit